jgi:hypothetical protein
VQADAYIQAPRRNGLSLLLFVQAAARPLRA